MAHHIYHTDGIVISKTSVSEWDARVGVFTRDLGLIFVHVKAYRRPESKLRSHLALFSYIRLSVVRGREVWRLVGVENYGLTNVFVKHKPARLVVGQIINVVRRLVKGEESHPALFDDILDSFKQISLVVKQERVLELENIELITLLRVLYHLGYIPDIPELRIFIDQFSWADMTDIKLAAIRRPMVQTINDSLRATHL